MCACVCLPPRLLIISKVIWTFIIDFYYWSNKFYSFCMGAVVGIIGRHTYTIVVFLPIGGIGVALTGQAIYTFWQAKKKTYCSVLEYVAM